MYDFIQMEGKHVLITGGASGIGRQTAITLSEMGALAGADVACEGLFIPDDCISSNTVFFL